MVVLVTGGSSGIGRASAELLAVAGGRVAVNSSDPAEADAVATTIIANGGAAIAFPGIFTEISAL
jgi:NAD(P)-dependent dehydrogenase (short-subunit alcohol dehydrogenase family)